MPEGLQIVIGADVSGAIRDIPKVGKSLDQIETQFADLLKTTGDFGKAIDELGKDGALSISFLQKQIIDFGKAFSTATDPDDIKKFGQALDILKIKQQQLINSAVPDHLDKVSHGAAGGTVATQRLSASLLGLSTHLGALPPELAGLTHGFDRIIENFEHITHGTEGASEKVLKFAGVLGEVGLGLGISIAIGLLIDLGKELFSTGDAFTQAEIDAAKFKSELEEVDSQIKLLSKNTDLATQIAKLRAQIKLGTGTEANILGDKSEIENNVKLIEQIDFQLDELQKKFGALVKAAPFQKLGEGAKQLLDQSSLVAGVPELFPKELVSKLKDGDKEFISEIEATNKTIHDLQTQREDIQNKNRLVELQIELERVKDGKKANKEYEALLKSRADIIREFTAKFESIKDPFPDFFTKNLPLGRVEDKALRAALENAFKVLSTAARDLFDTQKIDPGTIPLEIKFKPLPINRTDLVREIEEKFGEISKDVENAVNKGIFEVPIDFKMPSEGDGQALKVFEDRLKSLASTIEGLTGQKKAILDFDFDVSKLDESKVEKILEDLKNQINSTASGVPIKATVNADFTVDTHVDFTRLADDLKRQVADFARDLQSNIATSFGEAIGNSLSGLGEAKDSFQPILDFLSQGIKAIGVALIKIGLLSETIQKALAALSVQPELAIALGVAFIALSQVLKNSFNPRALGGAVSPNQRYLVNEIGQEIFQPNHGQARWIEGGKQFFTPEVSGKIIPAAMAKSMASRLNIKGLEAGGLVSAPTFALIGEGAGISKSNPEVIAPLSELRNMFGFGIAGELNINIDSNVRGKNLTRVLNRQVRSNNRLT